MRKRRLTGIAMLASAGAVAESGGVHGGDPTRLGVYRGTRARHRGFGLMTQPHPLEGS